MFVFFVNVFTLNVHVHVLVQCYHNVRMFKNNEQKVYEYKNVRTMECILSFVLTIVDFTVHTIYVPKYIHFYL